MDTFVECLVKKQKNWIDYLIILGSVFLALVLSVAAVLFLRDTFGLWLLLLAGAWYGVYAVVSRRSVEYEFSFTNGELDIDAIYARRWRKHLLSVRAREFILCAPVYDPACEAQYLNTAKIRRTVTAIGDLGSDSLYFADFLQNGDTVRLLFDPPPSFVLAMRPYNPRNIVVAEQVDV